MSIETEIKNMKHERVFPIVLAPEESEEKAMSPIVSILFQSEKCKGNVCRPIGNINVSLA